MAKQAAFLLFLTLAGCGHWEENLTLQDNGRGVWHLRWSALERGLTGEGHLDSARASWACTLLPGGNGWSVQAPSVDWGGSRLPKNNKSTWTGGVSVKGSTLVVDLKDANGGAFEGNGEYPLINRTPTHVYGRR